MDRFAKLAPAPADVSGMSRSESTDSQESGSWLNQVVKNSVEKLEKWIIPAPHPPRRPRTLTSLNSISEQGEPVLVQTWMNLLPIKHHPYDVEKYEVRNTFSVR